MINAAREILKSDESCISNPRSEILNWTVKCEVQFEISDLRLGFFQFQNYFLSVSDSSRMVVPTDMRSPKNGSNVPARINTARPKPAGARISCIWCSNASYLFARRSWKTERALAENARNTGRNRRAPISGSALWRSQLGSECKSSRGGSFEALVALGNSRPYRTYSKRSCSNLKNLS